jgi:hypothetical protein
MTPTDVIEQVRVLVNDARTPYRNSDTILLKYVNSTIKRISLLRPELFSVISEVTPTPNTCIQMLPSSAIRLVAVLGVKDGPSIREIDKRVIDASYPGWMSETASVPTSFMRDRGSINSYFLYPRPATGTVLNIQYTKVPDDYDLTDEITELTPSFLPVVIDGVVYLVESADDEHVQSGRAKMFLDSFLASLGVGGNSQQPQQPQEQAKNG